jgi:hypothetical protein
MPKTFYTERDIDDLHARGVTSIEVNDNIVLTDLARERMFKHGMRANRTEFKETPRPPVSLPVPAAPVSDEAFVQRVKSAVLARLNGQVDPVLLETVIRRVMAGIK